MRGAPLVLMMVSIWIALCFAGIVTKHYDIHLTRYDSIECEGDTRLGNKTWVPGNNKCHSWDDQREFRSFTYTWSPHFLTKHEKPEQYGVCKLHLYEGPHCDARYLDAVQDVNLENGSGSCVGNFTDYDKVPGLAKSVKLECHKKDRWPEIPPEPAYIRPDLSDGPVANTLGGP